MSNPSDIRKKGDDYRRNNPPRDTRVTEIQLWVEGICGRLHCASNATVRQVMSACADILGGRAERSEIKASRKQVDTSTSGAANAKGGQAVRKEPKWQQTDLGKSLKVLAHIASKVEEHKADTNLVKAWRNVQGTVGGAISRARRKDPPTSDDAIRTALDGMTSLTSNGPPETVVTEVNVLFRDEGYTEPTEAEISARRNSQRDARLAKRQGKEKKDNP